LQRDLGPLECEAAGQAFFGNERPGLARGRKKERSSLESACDELIDKGAIITGEWWAVCVRSWASSSSDRGLVDPQSPPLAQAHQ
jgi:hypothetical protein